MDMSDFDFCVEIGVQLNDVLIVLKTIDLSDLDEVNDMIPEIITIYETIEDVVKRANKESANEKLRLSIESDIADEDVNNFIDDLLWACGSEPVSALNKLMEMAKTIYKFDNEQVGAFIFFHEELNNSLVNAFDKVINKEYDYLYDVEDSEEFVKKLMNIPSELADYIDYDNLAEDLISESKWHYVEDYGYYMEQEV